MFDVNKLHLDWGYLEANHDGLLVQASANFCEHFRLNGKEMKGLPITDIVKTAGCKSVKQVLKKDILFGVINDFPCLVKITSNDQKGITFQVILKYEDEYRHELFALLNYADQAKCSLHKSCSGPKHVDSFKQIIGTSSAMEHVKELAARVSRGSSTVLITGESGTGKELFAQAIHHLSPRREAPFVPINCAAIPENLFESELFGYEGGAFSGARKEGKPGKIELAQYGTLFLDEISELPLKMQGKLLRVLQEREVERLGGTGRKSIDIRIVAATNRDLKFLVEEGKFRQDLYYRLLVFELKVPPLRVRKEDILPLAYHFLKEYNEEFGLNVQDFAPELKEWMLNYDWPGNVRELKSFIERGMNIVEGSILALDDVFFAYSNHSSERSSTKELSSLEEEVAKAEISAIERALKECQGNKVLAAEKLNIHLASLYRKMSKYGLHE